MLQTYTENWTHNTAHVLCYLSIIRQWRWTAVVEAVIWPQLTVLGWSLYTGEAYGGFQIMIGMWEWYIWAIIVLFVYCLVMMTGWCASVVQLCDCVNKPVLPNNKYETEWYTSLSLDGISWIVITSIAVYMKKVSYLSPSAFGNLMSCLAGSSRCRASLVCAYVDTDCAVWRAMFSSSRHSTNSWPASEHTNSTKSQH